MLAGNATVMVSLAGIFSAKPIEPSISDEVPFLPYGGEVTTVSPNMLLGVKWLDTVSPSTSIVVKLLLYTFTFLATWLLIASIIWSCVTFPVGKVTGLSTPFTLIVKFLSASVIVAGSVNGVFKVISGLLLLPVALTVVWVTTCVLPTKILSYPISPAAALASQATTPLSSVVVNLIQLLSTLTFIKFLYPESA